MTEPNAPHAPAPMLGARAAGWLGGLLLFGLLLLAFFARVDDARLPVLEKFSEQTAVGDRVLFPRPWPRPATPVIVARLGGEALVPVDYGKEGLRDTAMRAVARDPATKLTIYESGEAPAEGEKFYFVKTAANEYLKLRAQAAAN